MSDIYCERCRKLISTNNFTKCKELQPHSLVTINKCNNCVSISEVINEIEILTTDKRYINYSRKRIDGLKQLKETKESE